MIDGNYKDLDCMEHYTGSMVMQSQGEINHSPAADIGTSYYYVRHVKYHQ